MGPQSEPSNRLFARWAISIALFLDLLGFGMIIPDFQLRAEALGAKGWLIGAMLASSFLIQALVSPYWGRMGDRVGRGRILVLCQALSAGAMFVYALPGTLAILLISRALAGLGGANVVLAQSVIASGSSEESRAEALGKLGAAISGGLMLGPACGGFIASRWGSQAIGLTAAACSLSGLVLLAPFVLRGERISPDTPHPKAGWRLLASYPVLRRLFLIVGVAWFSLAMLEGTFGRLIERTMNFHQLQFGLVFSFESLVSTTVQGLLIAWMVSRVNESKLLRMAYLAQGIGLGLTPFCGLVPYASTWLAILLVVSGIYALGSGIAGPIINSYCSKAVPAEHHGELFGLLHSARSVGFIVGPILGGAVFDWYPAAPYLIAALTCCFASVLVPLQRQAAAG